MTGESGFNRACEMVRMHTPFNAAVEALINELQLTRDEAVAAMNAAHERADWGLDQADQITGRDAART